MEQTLEEALSEIANPFIGKSNPEDVLFVVLTKDGYWNQQDNLYTNDIAEAMAYSWTNYCEILDQCMSQIIFVDQGWFKIEIMAPAQI